MRHTWPYNEDMNTLREAAELPRLTSNDLCDACHVPASVRALSIDGELLFCGHHFTKHEDALMEWAYQIVDDREISPESLDN